MNNEQKKNPSNSLPIKVMNSPVAKVVLATTLMTTMGANHPVAEQLPSALQVGVETEDIADVFAGGKGTVTEPYLIMDVTQLDQMRNYLTSHFKLTNDIDLSGMAWIPILSFSGSMDGGGHTISGLPTSTDKYGGLFESLLGSVQNLHFTNITAEDDDIEEVDEEIKSPETVETDPSLEDVPVGDEEKETEAVDSVETKPVEDFIKPTDVVGVFAGGKGTVTDPYLISDIKHLDQIRNHLKNHFKLIADINLGGIVWEPILLFEGSMDGAGYTVDGLPLTTDKYGGLFKSPSGSIENLKFTNVFTEYKKSDASQVIYTDRAIRQNIVAARMATMSTVTPLTASATIRVGETVDLNLFMIPDDIYPGYKTGATSIAFNYQGVAGKDPLITWENRRTVFYNGNYSQKEIATFGGIKPGTSILTIDAWNNSTSKIIRSYDVFVITVLPPLDTTPPDINLTASTTNPTNQNVTVSASITDTISAVSEKKWAAGNQSAAYFASGGTVLGDSFEVSDNGVYTVYAKDSQGNATVKTITISNIDKIAPAVATFAPSTTDPTNENVSVTITYPGDAETKQYKIGAGGTWTTYSSSVVMSTNETIYARSYDAAGNVSPESQLVVANIDQTVPTITLTPTKIAPTNVAIDVDVDVIDNNPIVSKKWAKGNQDKAYFTTGGLDVVDDRFNVSENGIYTVFAKDSAGNTTIKTITVSNIDIEAPTITLTPSTLDATNAQIDVEIQTVDDNAIAELKWASGNQPISYFATDGTIVSDGKFIVSENGMYTVYAKDIAGNESVQTLTVSNLDFEAPVITLTPETIDPINTAIHVDVLVVDGNPIVEKKWAKGTQNLAYFASNGTILVGDQFLVSENDTYTVYAKDAAGNESLEYISVDNLDFDKPDSANFTLSNTSPTNTNVEVTITYPADAFIKEYKVRAEGTWSSYSGPVSVTENTTVFARSRDAAGNYSDETSISITNIDTTAPIIAIGGIVNGDTYVNEATPTYDVQDLNAVTVEVLLNGEAFTGGAVTDSGSYIYTVKATDAAGNVTTESMAFHVNHTPKAVGVIADKTIGKFSKETIDLYTLFADTEKDDLTFTVISSDPSIISAINTDASLEIEALRQGNSTITVIAHDKYSDSEAITFGVDVNSSTPVLTFTNEETQIIANDGPVTIKGTVLDADKDDVTITVTLGTVTKTVVIPTTGVEDTWSIELTASELDTGVYSININANDGYGSSVDLSSDNHIVKLPGAVAEYETTLSDYEKDIQKDHQDFTQAEHTVLLEAYVAMEGLKISSNPNTWLLVKPKVDALANGKVKDDFNRIILDNALDYLLENLDTATKSEYETAGIENVNPDRLLDYQDALNEYAKEKNPTDLTREEIQNVIDAVNGVLDSKENPSEKTLGKGYDAVNELDDGLLKDKLLEKLKEITVADIINNPKDTTTNLLENAGFDDVDKELEEEYKDAFTGYEQPLTDTSIQQLIDVVNQVKKMSLDLTSNDDSILSDMINRLSDSMTKTNLTLVYGALNHLYLTEQSFSQDNVQQAFDLVALVNTKEHTYLEKMVKSFKHVLTAIESPNDETVSIALAEVLKLDNGQLKNRFIDRVDGSYLEHVITSPGSTDYSDWINAGFEDMTEDTFPIYKEAVSDITNEVGPLTPEQIQCIIDAINAMEQAKSKPSNPMIQIAIDAINKVVDSTWKTDALAEMNELWKSIQPKPKPPVDSDGGQTPPLVVKPPVDLPKPSEKVMVSSNQYVDLVLEIPKIEVQVANSIKVKIKVTAKDALVGSTLYLETKTTSNLANGLSKVASINNLGHLIGSDNKRIVIDLGKLDKDGTIEIDRDLVFNEQGEYQLKGIFVTNGTNLETNTVNVSVFKELLIPNTVLPNIHQLPVATLKANKEIALYQKDSKNNLVRVLDQSIKASTLHLIQDTYKGFYQLTNGYYVQPGNVTVHIGKGEVRKKQVNVYDKNGTLLRTIKKGQQYKVYSYDDKRYAIGGGEYIEVQDGVTYVFGWMKLKESMTLYKNDGSVERTLKKGEKYRIYSVDQEYLHLGGGYKVKLDLTKFKFTKN